MSKEVDRVRTRAAMETVRESPVIALIAIAPVAVLFGAVWWLAGLGWAVVLLVLLGVGVALGGRFVR